MYFVWGHLAATHCSCLHKKISFLVIFLQALQILLQQTKITDEKNKYQDYKRPKLIPDSQKGYKGIRTETTNTDTYVRLCLMNGYERVSVFTNNFLKKAPSQMLHGVPNAVLIHKNKRLAACRISFKFRKRWMNKMQKESENTKKSE